MLTVVIDSPVDFDKNELARRARLTCRILFTKNVNFRTFLPQLRYTPIVAEVISINDAVSALNDGAHHVKVSGEFAERKEFDEIPADRFAGADILKEEVDLSEIPEKTLDVQSDRPDGLYSTVVCDERGIALGFCYSSSDSLWRAVSEGRGIYHSRRRGTWIKGETSGDTQKLLRVDVDCDSDCIRFIVQQHGKGFCHEGNISCFESHPFFGVSDLEKILQQRLHQMQQNPDQSSGSYTERLLKDTDLLHSKITEEAKELVEASSPKDVSWEAADVIYFAMVKLLRSQATLSAVESELARRHRKITRRPGNAKPAGNGQSVGLPPHFVTRCQVDIPSYEYAALKGKDLDHVLKRPIFDPRTLYDKVQPIIDNVRRCGDSALRMYTLQFDQVDLSNAVLQAPFKSTEILPEKTKNAIDQAWSNIYRFHERQKPEAYTMETAPGVSCQRVWRPIEKVGLYVPGGNNVLPSTALMLGIPAIIAGCRDITIATPPNSQGTISPEIAYIASRLKAGRILLAGGAQAIAAMAYGTASVPKCDKICGPGNQFVTAAKMLASTDTSACVAIDMPAGPSEVMVIADGKARPTHVAADLLSQAEHGTDSQVILLALPDFNMSFFQAAITDQIDSLPSRRAILEVSLGKARIIKVPDDETAYMIANKYAPEHLIINTAGAQAAIDKIENAGSLFLGQFAAESCGDYASGTNHTLPTYGFARVYGGVNVGTFLRSMTVQSLTKEGLDSIGGSVMTLAQAEGLLAHRLAVAVRLEE